MLVELEQLFIETELFLATKFLLGTNLYFVGFKFRCEY
jgi:hypothetical protein